MSKRVAGITGILTVAVVAAAPVHAQEDYKTIVTIMRACSQIDDVTARVTCYDNNIAPRTAEGAAASPPRAPSVPDLPTDSGRPAGFGAETLRQPATPATRAARPDEASLRVTAISERAPGIHLMSFDDGSQWQLVDAAPFSYSLPERGEAVIVERASLGSFMLRFSDQRALRIKRVR